MLTGKWAREAEGVEVLGGKAHRFDETHTAKRWIATCTCRICETPNVPCFTGVDVEGNSEPPLCRRCLGISFDRFEAGERD
jgi:hypothetical protein